MSDARSDVKTEAIGLVFDQQNHLANNEIVTMNQPCTQSTFQKLDIDCLEELFEWLSISDLRAMRQTCKRFKQAVDYFIRKNYPAVQFECDCIILNKYKFDEFRQLESNSVKLVKQLSLWSDELTENEIDIIRGMLPQLERFQIGIGQFDGDFYKTILRWCTKLKDLSICNIQGDKVIGDTNDWLQRQYSLLTNITLDDTDIGGPGNAWEIPELKTFFELNPNIQSFSTTFHFLWENRHCWLNSTIKIDKLNIQGDCFLENGMDRICGLLNKLNKHEFYKRIHLHATFIYTQDDMDQITSVRGMEKLYLACVEITTTIPPIPDLNELGINYDGDFKDFEIIAKNLINVERINFNQVKSDVIIPFMRYASKVKTIKVDRLNDGIYFKDGIINLSAFNEERKSLAHACKITIFINENIFLRTKFAIRSIDLELVKLKRIEKIV